MSWRDHWNTGLCESRPVSPPAIGSVDLETVAGVPGSLLKIVSDPAQIKDLYELLGDFCHQVRNRLHMLNMELYFAKVASHESQRSEWATLEQSYRAAERVVDHLQAICRPMPLTLL